MSIESNCPGCSTQLRVGEEHAGRQARCPQCGVVYTVPQPEETQLDAPHSTQYPSPSRPPQTRASAQTTAASASWYLQTPEGQTYGPVAQAEMDRWTSEGRVSADCLIRDSDTAPWRSAAEVYPTLAIVSPAVSPFAAQPTAAASTVYVEPHRAGVVFVLGLLSWVISCPVLSVVAWVMGTNDLKKMEAGRMDREGLGLTQAGRILGMISAILWIVGLSIFLLVMVLISLARFTM